MHPLLNASATWLGATKKPTHNVIHNKYICIYTHTSIEAHLWQASLLQRVINGVSVKAL